MRKTICALFVVLSTSTYAQRWLDVGLKAAWGPNFMLNKNIFNDGGFNHDLTSGYNFGVKLGYNLHNDHEITFDFMYGKFRQRFTYQDTNSAVIDQDKLVSYTTMDFMLLYRHNKDGRYLEVGPRYQLIKDGQDLNSQNSSATNVSSLMNESAWGMVLGFGNYFVGSENFGITLGLRVSYDFTDLISPAGQALGYPSVNDYPNYETTNPLSALIICEFNWDFGYLAKASCGKRTKLIMF